MIRPETNADALFATLPPDQREALRRCAVMALFDKDAYDTALRQEAGPDLAVLLDGRLVERLSGADDVYAVRGALQDSAWAAWFRTGRPSENGEVPAALSAVAERVVAYCTAHDDDVELLRALLLTNRRRARTWFRAAFAACDERLDIAGCTNLLGALREPARQPFVGKALAADLVEFGCYLAARAMWRFAYYASEPLRYLPRTDLEARLTAVLHDGDPRLVRLSGPAGYGKSTLLSWFVARRCVPRRIPCAMVDLDLPLDAVNATRHPWLLLLEIAEQLDGQMPGRPFQALLRDHGSALAVLTAKATAEGRAAAAALGTPTAATDEAETVALFVDALRDVGGPAPVVVLDTIEKAMVRPADDVGEFVRLLGRLVRETNLRIVVSGRHSAAEDALTAALPGAVEITVPAFRRSQARQYLQVKREIEDRALVTAIVDRAAGLPRKLAVWADVVEAHPDLSPAAVATVHAEATWVVDRIVGQIENPVLRWLVRYGVVPRTLRRDFAERVLLPRIVRARRGTTDDQPESDARPADPVPVFGTDIRLPKAGSAFAGVWDQLVRYSSTTSWLWLADGDDEAVVLHPEVRGPIAALLAAQPIGRLLHRDAAAYFTKLRPSDARWASWTCEAIYHRFCAADPEAAAYWREAVATAGQKGLGGETMAQIASEVIGPEYVDEDGRPQPLPNTDSPMIDQLTHAAAHAELAWAQCRIALRHGFPQGHATWSLVESNLATADRLGPDPTSDARRRAARAALDLARDRLEPATVALQTLSEEGELGAVDRCIVLLLLAQAQAAHPDRRWPAQQTLMAAERVADGLGLSEVTARIAVAVAEGAAALGRLDEAATGLDRIVANHPELRADPEVRRTMARCALDSGRPATALELTDGSTELGSVNADAQLALGDADGAERTCTDLLTGLVDPEGRAAVLVVRARANARLLRVDQAVDDLAGAREVYRQIGDVENAGLCTALAAGVMLNDVGSLLEAGQYLDEAARLPLDPGSPAWARWRLRTAERDARRGDRDAASKGAIEALDVVIGRCNDPRLLVEVALGAFCWSTGRETQIRGVLRTNLGLISPATARLTALGALADCPPWGWGRHLLKLALPTGQEWTGAQPLDAPWLELYAVELMRVAGRPTDAAELLADATDVLADRTPLAGWIWLLAARRPGMPRLAEHPAASRIPDSERSPLLAAAQAVTLAELRLDAGDRVGAVALLDPADEALVKATTRATAWKSRLHDLRRRLTEVVPESVQISGPGSSREWLLQEATQRELGYAPQATAVESAEPPPSTGAERTLRVSFDAKKGLMIESGATGVTLRAAHPLVASLAEETLTTGRSPVVRWVREQFERRAGLLALDGIVPPGDADLTLVADPVLAQLPWELATVGGASLAGRPFMRTLHRAGDEATASRTRVRMLQEALAAAGSPPGPIDGLHGPETAQALRAFQEQAGIPADGEAGAGTWVKLRAARLPGTPTVALLGQASVELAEAYGKRGWLPAVAPTADTADVQRALPGGPVDVVHIAATMQVTGSVPVLGMAGPGAQRRSERLTCTRLDALVRSLAVRGRTPLVVIDVAASPYLGEAVRQLLLRNDFAQQLLGLGQCYPVVATGPARSDDAKRLVAAVVGAPTAADLARVLQADDPEPDEVLPRAATALFTAVLPDRMPALNSPHPQQ